MKITKPGSRNQNSIWGGRCSRCGAEAEIEWGELPNIVALDCKDDEGFDSVEYFSFLTCPECGSGKGMRFCSRDPRRGREQPEQPEKAKDAKVWFTCDDYEGGRYETPEAAARGAWETMSYQAGDRVEVYQWAVAESGVASNFLPDIVTAIKARAEQAQGRCSIDWAVSAREVQDQVERLVDRLAGSPVRSWGSVACPITLEFVGTEGDTKLVEDDYNRDFAPGEAARAATEAAARLKARFASQAREEKRLRAIEDAFKWGQGGTLEPPRVVGGAPLAGFMECREEVDTVLGRFAIWPSLPDRVQKTLSSGISPLWSLCGGRAPAELVTNYLSYKTRDEAVRALARLIDARGREQNSTPQSS